MDTLSCFFLHIISICQFLVHCDFIGEVQAHKTFQEQNRYLKLSKYFHEQMMSDVPDIGCVRENIVVECWIQGG
jgi:hypothetical protein